MPGWNPRANDIFLEALELDSLADREALLVRRCGRDVELRQQVESLLAASQKAGGFLEDPIVSSAPLSETVEQPAGMKKRAAGKKRQSTIDQANREQPGAEIGPYKLLQPIGEGGMGVVYMAEQTQPVKRRVALKIIKPGMDTRQVIARFEAERQALAMMDHPNIAKVLDAGTTDIGRPYFVMELVNGIPVTKYCDEQHLTPKERLELFVPICQAVQHAHQKGVIHRDLKPSNILVALYDGRAVPKVIDFGISKATNQSLTEKTLFTQLGQVVGTLEYMSPEQAGRNQLDIDTRSDIYSLGVVLYELLTGETPFDRKRMMTQAFDEMLRIIREEEPSKPSTKVDSSPNRPAIAANRRVEPTKLGNVIRGELDWIVLKALEKDRARRYETASAFAKDIEHHLCNEPVQACPQSLGYRVRKFANKHKRTIVPVCLFALFLVGATVFSSWLAIRATRAEAKLVEALAIKESARAREASERKRAEQSERIATAAKERSQKRLGQIETANDILGSIFSDLDPNTIRSDARPLQAILLEKLEKAADELDGESIGDPFVVADMQMTLGRSLIGLGEPNKAAELLEKARATWQDTLGADDPNSLSATCVLGNAYTNAGQLKIAVELLTETVARHQQVLGAQHPDTVEAAHNLALAYSKSGKLEQALPLMEATYRHRKMTLGESHTNTLITANNLAEMYRLLGDYRRAMDLASTVAPRLSSGRPHGCAVHATITLANCWQEMGVWERAMSLYEQARGRSAEHLGSSHPVTLTAIHNLANAHRQRMQFDKAIALFEECLEVTREKFGNKHPETLSTMHGLAACYAEVAKQGQETEKRDLALAMFKQTLKDRIDVLGPEHHETLGTQGELALFYFEAGQLDLAISLHEKTLESEKKTLGPDHPDAITTMANLATAYSAAGKKEASLSLLEEVVQVRTQASGEKHRETLISMNNLVVACLNADRLEKAIAVGRKSLALAEEAFGPDHHVTAAALANLGTAYLTDKQGEKALPLQQRSLRIVEEILGTSHVSTNIVRQNIAAIHTELGDPKSAIPLYEEALKWMKNALGPTHPNTVLIKGNLSKAYIRAGERDLAMTLASEALENSKQLNTDHPNTAMVLSAVALTFHYARESQKALPVWDTLLKRSRRVAGPEDQRTIEAIGNVAETHMDLGNIDQALMLYWEMFEIRFRKLGLKHGDTSKTLARIRDAYAAAGVPKSQYLGTLIEKLEQNAADVSDIVDTKSELANALATEEEIDKAIEIFKEVEAWKQGSFGEESVQAALASLHLASALTISERFNEAIEIIEDIHDKLSPETRPDAQRQLFKAYLAAGMTNEATALIPEIVADGRSRHPNAGKPLASLWATIGAWLIDAKVYHEAEPLLRECVAIRMKEIPDSTSTSKAQAMLGIVLFEEQILKEAERCLEAGLLGMKDAMGHLPIADAHCMMDAAERLVELYKTRGGEGDADKAQRWQVEVEALRARPTPATIAPGDGADDHFQFALDLIERKRSTDAVRELRETLRIKPGHAEARSALGELFESEGNLHAAVREYRHLVKLNPQDAHAHQRLAWIQSTNISSTSRLYSPYEALQHARVAVMLDDQSMEALWTHVVSACWAEEWQEARTAIEAFQEVHPLEGRHEIWIAMIHAGVGEMTEARNSFERSREFDARSVKPSQRDARWQRQREKVASLLKVPYEPAAYVGEQDSTTKSE